MNLVLIVVELCYLRTFKYVFESTLLLILPMTIFSSGFPDVVGTISITVVIIVICSSVNTYFSYVELSLYTWFVERKAHIPPGISTSIYDMKLKFGRVMEDMASILCLRDLVWNLKTTNHFQTKLCDHVDDVNNRVYLSR